MRGPFFNADALRTCSRLTIEIAGLLNIHNRFSDLAESAKFRARRRSLHIEPLETRHLLDAAGAASLISAVWFQDVSDQADVAHAGVADWTVNSNAASEQSAASAAGQPDVYDWIVQFDTSSVANISSVTETAGFLAGGGVEFDVLRGLGLVGQVLVRSSDASIEAVQNWLSENTYISSYERDAISQIDTSVPSDPLYNQLWGMSMIDAPEAWSLSTGSSSVVVAVIDTGVDYTHVDLAANMWTNPGEIAGNGIDDDGNGFVDDVYGYDFVNNDGNPMDDNAHGTHVSGTIAAMANNGLGVAGVNWSSSIMALKFLDSNGSGYLSDAVRAVNYATMMRTQYDVNVKVMNNSWGGGGYSSSMYNAIQASNNADILFVAAAGNSSTNNDLSPQYPANYSNSNVISVAAVSQSGQLASFSSYGATTVDLAAPGVSIYSTIPGNRYAAYSGTSMATPHVAGVAALAFTYAPDATATQVRDAILAGAEYSSALAGKTATSGILNALNTLELLSDQLQGPAISHLTASPATVMSGDSVTITAHGVSDNSGTVTQVLFYRDVNNNSQYDVGDTFVGATSSIVSGVASVSFNTSGYAAGSYRFLAKAVDNHGESSNWAGTTVTVLAADDHGDNAATASAISVPGSTSATLGIVGDADWFAFQAVAGKSYTFSTTLNTLPDSVLYLYGSNGSTKLGYNDDIVSGNFASRIQWTAPSSGTYFLAVAGYGNNYSGSYTLNVEVDNSAPVLGAIADQSISHSQTTLTVPINATDANGDSLSYSVAAYSVSPLANEAYEVDQEYGLYQWGESFWTNLRGQNEKYFAGYYEGGRNAYFILPSGDLYRWGGSIESSVYVTAFSADYYNDPFLLCNAQSPEYTPVDGNDVQLSMSGDTLTIVRSSDYLDDVFVQVQVTDGLATDTESFWLTVTNSAPEMSSIGDQTWSNAQVSLTVEVVASDVDGDSLSYSAEAFQIDPLEQQAYQSDQEYGLYQWNGNFWTDLRGANEKYFAGYYQGDRNAYFILPDGELYRWSGSIADSVHVTTLSAEYYNNPFLVCNAVAPDYISVDASDVQFDFNGNEFTVVRASDYLDNFVVQVRVSDGVSASTDSFSISLVNAAPELSPVADQTMFAGTSTLTISIEATDADGDSLSYSAEAMWNDPLSADAYQLDQEYGLYQWEGSFWDNLRGANEKYFAGYYQGNRNPFFILPGGELYRWGGSLDDSVHVVTLSADYYNNPHLLCDAQPPGLSSLSSELVVVGLQDDVLTITRDGSYSGNFIVQVSVTDGVSTSSEMFNVSAVGAASLRSASLATALPADGLAVSNVLGSLPAESPDLRLIWSNYYTEDRRGWERGAASSADLLASRIGDLSAMLHDDVFSRLSSAVNSPHESEDALLGEIVESISAIRREVDGMLLDRDDFDLNSSHGDDALGYDFLRWESLERSAVDLIHESLSEQSASPS